VINYTLIREEKYKNGRIKRVKLRKIKIYYKIMVIKNCEEELN